MKVPAVYETEAGILFFCMFFTIAFTDRSTKYAFSPSGKIGSSIVWFLFSSIHFNYSTFCKCVVFLKNVITSSINL